MKQRQHREGHRGRRDKAGPPRLTQFQNVMPWVMMAPFGRPVVPEVYMMVETSSCVTLGLLDRLGAGDAAS